MKEKGLVDFFENYLQKQPLFKDKLILQSNYTPENIAHRDEQIQLLANILAPVLRGEKPSNVFIYGKTGTGKTLTARYTTNQLSSIAKQKDRPLKVIYLNCKLKKLADTEYRLIAQLLREYGRDIPPTGLPTDEVYQIFFTIIEKEKHNLILILDEVDQLIGKAGDELLYNLTRINSELKNAQITIIGISNDLVFTDTLDPRVKSSLSEEEIVFPPYNAIHIQNILSQRAQLAFRPGTLEEGLIEKCAGFAAREHGDARRALELLRVAGELAEREGEAKVAIAHLDKAEDKIERDRVVDLVANQPKQYQATLLAILNSCQGTKGVITGEIYSLYEKYCTETGLRPLTQRRISDVIAELDMLGIINAKVISKGRYGRTREITVGVNDAILQKIKNILLEELGLWNNSS
ncbi:ORC1-type DNA replication protein [Candidatus Woesearchaeota archaeon]|nr:ORC1-type DNA replication protein [Candidatus Woesearchaeota archaeon]